MNSTMETLAVGDSEDNNGRCELLGPFALFVQGALGALALLTLVWKRSRENPQRPLLIWFFDASKQVWGSVLVHIANLGLSMLSSGQFSTDPSPKSMAVLARQTAAAVDESAVTGQGYVTEDGEYHSNPCSFYLLNLGIDTTIGIFILIVILRVLHRLLLASPFKFWHTGITSGEYGDPPRWSWWAKQAIVYFCGLMGMKIVVALMFAIFPWLGRFGDWLLQWTEGDKRVQVFFVMFFFPLVMNGVQYYIIDSYIKASGVSPSHPSHDTTGPIPHSARTRPFDHGDDVFTDSDNDRNLSSSTFSGSSSYDEQDKTDSEDDAARLLLDGAGSRPPKTRRAKKTKSIPHRNPIKPLSTKSSSSSAKSMATADGDEYDPDRDGLNLSTHLSPPPTMSRDGDYFAGVVGGEVPVGRRERRRAEGGADSEDASVLLLPGSRGPGSPSPR